ncbi:MAG TPA: hypothetical protein VFV95_00425 [Vicinamibacterales bacterium]|nr:hypothetical protein [Vicinamibacterales bacterium]
MQVIGRCLSGHIIGGVISAVMVLCSAPPAIGQGNQAGQPGQPPAWKETALQPGVYREHKTAHQSESIDVPVPPNGGEIEYMVNMKQGDTMVYSWRAVDIADAAKLTSEFHGHTERAPGTTGTLVFYRKATGASENGSLIAPFDGTHGWYFKNDTARPVVVRVTLSGFYTVIPNQIKK